MLTSVLYFRFVRIGLKLSIQNPLNQSLIKLKINLKRVVNILMCTTQHVLNIESRTIVNPVT